MQLQYPAKLKLPTAASPTNGSTTTAMRQYLERSRARRALLAGDKPARGNATAKPS